MSERDFFKHWIFASLKHCIFEGVIFYKTHLEWYKIKATQLKINKHSVWSLDWSKWLFSFWMNIFMFWSKQFQFPGAFASTKLFMWFWQHWLRSIKPYFFGTSWMYVYIIYFISAPWISRLFGNTYCSLPAHLRRRWCTMPFRSRIRAPCTFWARCWRSGWTGGPARRWLPLWLSSTSRSALGGTGSSRSTSGVSTDCFLLGPLIRMFKISLEHEANFHISLSIRIVHRNSCFIYL